MVHAGRRVSSPSDPSKNPSEIVAYDPAGAGFCTYQPPGGNNEVFGMAATGIGTNTKIWFDDLENSAPAIDSFVPSTVGMDCSHNTKYFLTSANSFRQITSPQWNAGQNSPLYIAPDGNQLWVTDFTGHAIDNVNTTTGAVTPYVFGQTGSEPYEIAADSNYVYAIDAGDTTLVRLNKAHPTQIDEVPLPVTSDQEGGYGLALSGPAGQQKLYFTLFDDPGIFSPVPFDAATTIGYVDIGAWEAASANCAPGVDCAPQPANAVVFTGLSAQTNKSGGGDFRRDRRRERRRDRHSRYEPRRQRTGHSSVSTYFDFQLPVSRRYRDGERHPGSSRAGPAFASLRALPGPPACP